METDPVRWVEAMNLLLNAGGVAQWVHVAVSVVAIGAGAAWGIWLPFARGIGSMRAKKNGGIKT